MPSPTDRHPTGGRVSEVADRCWVLRQDWMDLNVVVVAGEESLLVVDTYASTASFAPVLDAVRRLSPLPVSHVVNTHVHFDHTFGNALLAAQGAELVCHEACAEALPAHAAEVKDSVATERRGGDERWAGVAATEVVVPGRTFSSALVLDLGGRGIELVHPGRGHTSGDLVVRVPDADLVLAGDLVEESAERQGVPGFGDDCWPLEWPQSLDVVLGLLTADSVVVPGHGSPVDRGFVEDQRNDVGLVAQGIRDHAGQGRSVEEALRQPGWPFPVAELATAVSRGFAQLPRSARTLRLIPSSGASRDPEQDPGS